METLQLNVKTLRGCVYIVNVLPHETIEDGKKKIPDKSVEVQRWVHDRRNLEDHQTFQELGIKHDDIIHLVLNLRGGGINFSSLDKTIQITTERVNKDTPVYLIIETGLNIRCFCDWKSCTTQKHGGNFYVVKGLGMHDMAKLEVRCPECTQPAHMVTSCFFNCSYRIYGVLSADKKSIHIEGKVQDGKAEEYNDNKTAEWDSLTIQCFGHVVPYVKE